MKNLSIFGWGLNNVQGIEDDFVFFQWPFNQEIHYQTFIDLVLGECLSTKWTKFAKYHVDNL